MACGVGHGRAYEEQIRLDYTVQFAAPSHILTILGQRIRSMASDAQRAGLSER